MHILKQHCRSATLFYDYLAITIFSLYFGRFSTCALLGSVPVERQNEVKICLALGQTKFANIIENFPTR